MATHGPSFRFAPPRAKDSTPGAASGAASRLPTRTNNNDNTTPNGPNPALSSSIPAPAAGRTPAKLRRKNMPEEIRTNKGALGSNSDLHLDTALDSGVQFPPSTVSSSLPTSATSTSRLPRNPFAPKPTETIACIIGPNPSLARGSSQATTGNVAAKTLRRKPSVIGSFMSARRLINSSGNSSSTTTASSQSDQIPATASATNTPIDQQIPAASTPFTQPPSRPATAGNDSYGMYNAPTPLSDPSTTPSLRHTDSPSVFSRAASTTPTSQTSYSPLISQSPHFGPGIWNSPRKPGRDHTLLGFHGVNSLPAYNSVIQAPELNRSKAGGQISPIPELAHLANDPSPQTTSPRKAPARPSRDNTPTLDPSDFAPIVFSDLPPMKPQHHRRQSSSSAPEIMSKMPGAVSSDPAGTYTLSESLPALILEPTNGSSGNKVSHEDNRSALSLLNLSESSKSHSRFGFLTRRDKTKSTNSDESDSRQPKKGPMAGTGHEGYGKYAPGGKNGIPTAPNGSVNRSTSKPRSTKPSPKLLTQNVFENGTAATSDNFLTQRTSPVYLRGNGENSSDDITPRQIVRSDSSSSVAENDAPRNSNISSGKTSSGSGSSVEPSRLSFKASAIPTSTATSISSRGASSRGRGSWGSSSRGPDRAMSRGRPSSAGRANRDTNDAALAKARQKAADAASLSKQSTASNGKKSNWSLFSKSPQKAKTTTKWNPFQRSQSLPPDRDTTDLQQVDPDIPVPTRAIAHYEVSEHGSGNNNQFDLSALKDLMEEVDGVHSEYQSDTDDLKPGVALSKDKSRDNSMMFNETAQILTSHLKLSPELYGEHIKQGSKQDVPASEQAQSRPSRLAQVGRIPKVVSTREVQAPRVPAKSFSRPLFPPPRTYITIPDADSIQTGSTSSLISQSLQGSHADLIYSGSTTQDNGQWPNEQVTDVRDASPEFFSLRRHNSEYSYSSSSGTFYFPSAALTAIVPTMGSPTSEDEVWNEYDDFIDNVLTPVTSADKAGNTVAKASQQSVGQVSSHGWDSTEETTPRGKTAFPKLSDMASTLRPDLSPFVGTQRRSEVFSGFELPEPSPVDSCFDCSEEEEEEETITIQSEGYKPAGANSRTKEHQDEKANGHDDADSMKLTPKSMANLRFGALMTSKWLSFGRVLFSPAHYDLINATDDRVLVIDGLGTDWSYFTALTYPNLTVYSLGPGSLQQTPGRQTQGPWQPLANHRHLSHNDMTSNFPFPKNFFAVVVFRFPTATTEIKMRMTLSECKRVLQPGGYIEVSSLDLDLTNMGNKARRAIRALKTMMQESVPDVCLKPASDNIQCLLGRRGFENLSRCVVGVPAAGVIGDSKTNSREEQEMSFTRLMDDQSQAGDEVMTKMVAKVGRWWYLKTYEMCALPVGDVSRSIWNDISLLRECEKHETAFKLFICYAQKPTLAKRRTVSL